MNLKPWVKPEIRQLSIINTESTKSRVYADGPDLS
jgi:hypothetical protein